MDLIHNLIIETTDSYNGGSHLLLSNKVVQRSRQDRRSHQSITSYSDIIE